MNNDTNNFSPGLRQQIAKEQTDAALDAREAREQAVYAAERDLRNPDAANPGPVNDSHRVPHPEYAARPNTDEVSFEGNHPMNRNTAVDKQSPLGAMLAANGDHFSAEDAKGLIDKMFAAYPALAKWASATYTMNAEAFSAPSIVPPPRAATESPRVAYADGLDMWRESAFWFLKAAGCLKPGQNVSADLNNATRRAFKECVYRHIYSSHDMRGLVPFEMRREDLNCIRAWYQLLTTTTMYTDIVNVTPSIREKNEDLIRRLDGASVGIFYVQPERIEVSSLAEIRITQARPDVYHLIVGTLHVGPFSSRAEVFAQIELLDVRP